MSFTNSRKKLRHIENMIMLTFTAVVFAGCAGNDIKSEKGHESMPGAAVEKNQTYASSKSYPVTPIEVSSTETTAINALSAEPKSNDTDKSDAVDVATATNLPENSFLFYDTDKYQLIDGQRTQIQPLAEFLKSHTDVKLAIYGHADIRGTEKYNQSLSEKRAKTVFDLLVSLGVPPQQLVMQGYGELKPLHDKNNWDENRRVELNFTDSKTKLSSNM